MEKEYTQEFLIEQFEKKFGKISEDGSYDNYLRLKDYIYPLPCSIIEIIMLDLKLYKFPLSNYIVDIDWLFLDEYNFPLPNTIKNIKKILLTDYKHKLPKSITDNYNDNIQISCDFDYKIDNIEHFLKKDNKALLEFIL